MNNIHLVAVQHGDRGELMSMSMFPLIQFQVIPLLTSKSVLVVEGGNRRGKMESNHPDYRSIYQQLGPIYMNGLTPTIHSDDPMWWEGLDAAKEFHDSCHEYETALGQLLVFDEIPRTWEGLVEKIKTKNHKVRLMVPISDRFKLLAQKHAKSFKRRDEVFANQIFDYSQEGRDVFFFGGLLHCLSLSATHGWSVIKYEVTEDYVKALYLSWYLAYAAADLLD